MTLPDVAQFNTPVFSSCWWKQRKLSGGLAHMICHVLTNDSAIQLQSWLEVIFSHEIILSEHLFMDGHKQTSIHRQVNNPRSLVWWSRMDQTSLESEAVVNRQLLTVSTAWFPFPNHNWSSYAPVCGDAEGPFSLTAAENNKAHKTFSHIGV